MLKKRNDKEGEERIGMKLTYREKFILIVSISIISVILYVLYFYKPLISETNNLMDQFYKLNEDVIQGHSIHAELKNLNNELLDLRSALTIFHDGLFDQSEQARIVLFFEKLIEPIGLGKRIRFNEVEDCGLYKIARVEVCVEASYTSVQQILTGIEQSHWKNRIEKMSARILSKEGSIPHRYDMELELIVGFYCQ